MAKYARELYPNGKTVRATDVYRKTSFYCNNEGCSAEMYIVSMGSPSAHFKSKAKREHRFTKCIRSDVIYNTDKYDNNLFQYDTFKIRMLKSSEKKNHDKHNFSVGSGSRIAPHTLKSLYASYINSLDSGNDAIGDSNFSHFMCCRENCDIFLSNPNGFFVVETSFYHKVKDELAFILNVPIYEPNRRNAHIKVVFNNETDFCKVYKHYRSLKNYYKSIFLVAGEFKSVDNQNYIAECTIYKSSQHAYIND